MNRLVEINFCQSDIKFAILIFPEIKYLIYKPLKNLDILIGYFYQGQLLRGEVVCPGKLGYRLGNESQGGAQVEGDIGVE